LFDIATRRNDETSLEALRTLRKKLDDLQELRTEDLTGLTKDQRDGIGEEDDVNMESLQEAMAEFEDEDTAGIVSEDEIAVAQAESEV
jgi:hypothetical protein